MGSLGLGALGAILETNRLIPSRLTKSRTGEILALLLTVLVLTVQFRFRPPLMGIASLYLVLKAFRSDFQIPVVKRLLEAGVATYLGRISYGLYLFHIPVSLFATPYLFDPIWHAIPFETFGFLEKLRWHPWVFKLPLYSLITVGVAALSFRFLERPILDMKSKWFPYKKSSEPGS